MNEPCILSGRAIRCDGYVKVYHNGKSAYQHRIVYEKSKGKIKKGFVVDHLCRNRACMNINHLEVVSQKENVLRGIGVAAKNSKKTHCKNGHELSFENIIKRKKINAGRDCKVCHKIREQLRRGLKK